MINRLGLALGIALTTMNPTGFTHGQQPTSKEQYLDLMHSMNESRTRLLSGQFVAKGDYRDESSPAYPLSGQVRYVCSFDHTQRKLRFDRTEPELRMAPKDKSKGQAAKSQVETVTSRLIQAGDSYSFFNDRTNRLVLNYDPERIPRKPFDPRSLGLFFWADFARGEPYPETFERMLKEIPASIEKDESAKLFTLRWKYPTFEKTIVLDASCGFSPVKLHVVDHGSKAKPETVAEVTWDLVSDIWLPVRFKLVDNANLNNSSEVSLAFEWGLVNKPIPEETFDPNKLAKDQTIMVDMSSGRAIVLDQVTEKPTTVSRSVPFYWILVSAVVIFGVAIYLLVRRRKTGEL